MESQIPLFRKKKWDNLLEKHYKLYCVDITQLQLHYWITPVQPSAGEFISTTSIRANGKYSSKAFWIYCIFCKKCFSCWDCTPGLTRWAMRSLFLTGFGKNHTSTVGSHGQWHLGLSGLWKPLQMCLFQSLDGWPSARETSKGHSVPRAELPAFEFSLSSRYAHCPQLPPLIDLGPVPVSNCFLQIGFAPDCWLLSSNFSPPLSMPSLTHFLRSLRAKGLAHQLIPGPQRWHLFIYFFITLKL